MTNSKHKRPGITKRIYLFCGKTVMRLVVRMSGKLTPERIERWGRNVGWLIFTCIRSRRSAAIDNLTHAFPEWEVRKVKLTARACFNHFSRGALEFFRLLHITPEQIDDLVEIEGKEYLDEAFALGKGVIVVTAHFGNWEYGARKLVREGYKLSVIARDSDDVAMTGISNDIRQSGGYRVLSRDNAALPAIRCLRRNEIVGILPDQNTTTGIFVDFFGRPVATAEGPATFALRSGAAIVCGFTHRLQDGKFQLVLQPALQTLLSGDEATDIHAVTQAFTKVIEDEIRKDPPQWLWFHKRWKRTSEAVNRVSSLEASS